MTARGKNVKIQTLATEVWSCLSATLKVTSESNDYLKIK